MQTDCRIENYTSIEGDTIVRKRFRIFDDEGGDDKHELSN